MSESECRICSSKEKSQFLLNVLRYIQHTHLNSEVIKIEIFKVNTFIGKYCKRV